MSTAACWILEEIAKVTESKTLVTRYISRPSLSSNICRVRSRFPHSRYSTDRFAQQYPEQHHGNCGRATPSPFWKSMHIPNVGIVHRQHSGLRYTPSGPVSLEEAGAPGPLLPSHSHTLQAWESRTGREWVARVHDWMHGPERLDPTRSRMEIGRAHARGCSYPDPTTARPG